MGEMGKELLRERIRNKRANEGLEDIPPEQLFPKVPRYDLSDDEKQRICERRQRNKEAAEKSRKKKREEFEKLQHECDQHVEDKREMAAMIEKLKKDLSVVQKENSIHLKENSALKRWIAKRVVPLGLNKHVTKEDPKEFKSRDGKLALMHGNDPPIQPVVAASPPPPPHSPPMTPNSLCSCSPPPPVAQEGFQAVGLRTLVCPTQAQSPWLVDQPARADNQVAPAMDQPVAAMDLSMTKKEAGAESGKVPVPVPVPVPAYAPTLQLAAGADEGGEERQVMYLPKDTIIILENGQQLGGPTHHAHAGPALQFHAHAPENHAVLDTATASPAAGVTAPPGYVTASGLATIPGVATGYTTHYSLANAPVLSTPSVLATAPVLSSAPSLAAVPKLSPSPNLASAPVMAPAQAEAAVATGSYDTPLGGLTTMFEPSVATAIECLLKMGCKIEIPAGQSENSAMTGDHGYEAQSVFTVPVDMPESAGTVTVG